MYSNISLDISAAHVQRAQDAVNNYNCIFEFKPRLDRWLPLSLSPAQGMDDFLQKSIHHLFPVRSTNIRGQLRMVRQLTVKIICSMRLIIKIIGLAEYIVIIQIHAVIINISNIVFLRISMNVYSMFTHHSEIATVQKCFQKIL